MDWKLPVCHIFTVYDDYKKKIENCSIFFSKSMVDNLIKKMDIN